MRRTLTAALAAALALGGVSAAGSAHPALAFAELEHGTFTLMLAGSTQPLVTGAPAAPTQRLAWSPDGRALAFVCADFQLCLLDTQSGSIRPLTRTGWPGHWQYDGDPSWSPDGKTIAFDSNRSGAYRIYLLRAADQKLTPLPSTAGQDGHPAWSSTGRQIAFDSSRRGIGAVYVVGADGRGLHRLTPAGTDAHSPAWSPDGTTIAYSQRTTKGYAIELVAATGGRPRQLTDGTHRDNRSAFSPDGRTIAFDSNRSTGLGIWTVSLAGGQPQALVEPRTPALLPAWRPTGSRPAGSRSPTPDGQDQRLVATLVAGTIAVGSDLVQQANALVRSQDLDRDAALAESRLRAMHPSDLRGRRLQATALTAFTTARTVARDFIAAIAAITHGQRTRGNQLARASYLASQQFATQLNAANTIAGLPTA